MSKQCVKCKTIKSIKEFRKQKTMHDGHQAYCQDCCSISSKKYRSKLQAERDLQVAIYRHQLADYCHEFYFEYPEHLKTFSHYLVHNNLHNDIAFKNHMKYNPLCELCNLTRVDHLCELCDPLV